ncbi:MAG: caspase family protein [Archangium sp.]|nr:caspase family protein [Archangium sp.]
MRLLLSIGSDLGNPDEAPLQHAEDDAKRMRDLFVELGSVEPARALVLTRATAPRVTERFAELQGRVAELKAAGKRVELIVFASAHGKSGALHLTGTSLPLETLRELSKQCGADLTITIVDACQSGIALKGAAKGPAYALSVQPPSVTGEVFIASSGASESAQEWDVLSGSLFTHHLISGLRGDADTDSDGRVSLMESYAYAERRTVANSVDQGQHPEFAVALEGSSDVVLTSLSNGRARVTLDETMEGRFVLVSQPRADVVTEVTKTRGRSVTLAVPPGRYLLRQARGFSVALQEVELPWGGATRVDPRKFVTRDFAEVALKGGDVGFHPHALQLQGGVATPPIEGTPLRWSVGLGYRLTIGQFWASLSAGWGSARFRGVDLTTHDNRFAARLVAGPRFWVGPVTLMPGLGVEGAVLRQESVRDREVDIRRSYPALPVRVTPSFGIGPHLRVELPVIGPLFAALSVTAWVRALNVVGLPAWTIGGDSDIALGVRF